MTTSGAPTIWSTRTARRWTTSATSAAATPDRGRRGGGFTILELLVVLGIVVALFGLTLPFMLDGLDRRRAASVRDRIDALVFQARALARSEAVAIEIVCAEDGGRLVAHRFEPSAGGLDADAEDAWPQDDPVDAEGGGEIRATWATLVLDPGIRCVAAPESSILDRPSAGGVADLIDVAEPPDGSDAGWGAEVRLAAILPDGTAIQLRPFMVGMPGAEREGRIDPLTGRILWRDPGAMSIPPADARGSDADPSSDIEEDDLLVDRITEERETPR